MARLVATALLLALSIAAELVPARAATQVGSAAAVRNDVRGSVTGPMSSGSPVHQSEAVASGADSSAQLLFRDKTSLTVGPNSRVVIDRFVYNPQTGSGSAAVSVAKGALRFVTGSQPSDHYAVRTPLASIGVRGTIAEMFVSELGWEVFVLIQGAFDACAGGVCRQLTVPGHYVVVFPGGGLSNPAPWPGPMLDLTASANFVDTYFASRIDQGIDGLPRYRDLNDALRTRKFEPPACDYYCD